MSTIPPGERRELRSVVRSQFKVLRAEVEQREAELRADAEQQLMKRYRTEDKAMDDLNWRINQVVDQANNDIADLMKAAGADQDGGTWNGKSYRLGFPRVSRKNEDRQQLRTALMAGIRAQVKSAQLALDRQEADLLRQLAIDALETEAAQAFLGRIPPVGQLVPSARLLEIEAAFDESKDGAS
jgi:hypothetical protein